MCTQENLQHTVDEIFTIVQKRNCPQMTAYALGEFLTPSTHRSMSSNFYPPISNMENILPIIVEKR